jgi:hypothetical protein
VVKRKTAGSRFQRAVKRMADWLRLNRHLALAEQYRNLALKVRGHFAYYGGLIGNVRCLQRFRNKAMRLWQMGFRAGTGVAVGRGSGSIASFGTSSCRGRVVGFHRAQRIHNMTSRMP